MRLGWAAVKRGVLRWRVLPHLSQYVTLAAGSRGGRVEAVAHGKAPSDPIESIDGVMLTRYPGGLKCPISGAGALIFWQAQQKEVRR